MLDSRLILKRFGKVEETEIEEVKPDRLTVTFRKVSPRFPEDWALFPHQMETIEALRHGRNVVLCSGTSSGKTEAVLLGMLDSIKQGLACQALYVYPTKPLTSDQKQRFDRYLPSYGLRSCIYDFDHIRTRAKEIASCEFVLTNSEMLLKELKDPHSNIVARLKNLRYLVLDEVHIYTAYQINLLLAMAKVIRECITPDFMMCILSATIGNPDVVADAISGINGKNATVIRGRANHPKIRVVFMPKISRFTDEYRPENWIAAEIAKKYAHDDASTIIFNDTIKDAGMIGSQAYADVGDRVAIHYGSLDKERRIEGERNFKNGHTKVMVTAKTLQQGIDIGNVQRVVHVGLPERQADFWQRQGRMGRREHIKLCESIVIPSPRSAFDMFICSGLDRFRQFLGRRIERVIVKPDSKILRMFVGCTKLIYGKALEDSEVDFLRPLKLVQIAPSITRYFDGPGNIQTFELSAYGRDFIGNLHFYTGETPDVSDRHGNKVKGLRVYSIFGMQPNCILFNNDLRDPEFYLVDDFDPTTNNATVMPVSEAFSEDVAERIARWKRFSITKTDFSTTNPDSTFGNIVLKPVAVYHVESRPSKSGRNLSVVEKYTKVAGREEFPSNYIRADVPTKALGHLPNTLHDELLVELVLEAAFSCIRNGLREKFDLGYDEFSHVVMMNRDSSDTISPEFLFYETSCSDLIYDLNWREVRESARAFLGFVKKIDDARFFYIRGSGLHFAQINDLPSRLKPTVYDWIDKTIDVILDIMEEKLSLASRVKEDDTSCLDLRETHSYVDTCVEIISDILGKSTEFKFLEAGLSVFFVDNYLDTGHAFQKVTFGASRARDVEGRYVMWLAISALRKLSKNGVLALILHEFTHLLFLNEEAIFENPQEEEAEVHSRLKRDRKHGRRLQNGTAELDDMLVGIKSADKKYTESELMTTAGKVIENLRWQKSRKIGYVHMFRQGTEFKYHVLKTK